MWYLGIDTSTAVTSVCLRTERGDVHEAHNPGERHQEEITMLVEQVLRTAGIKLENLHNSPGLLVGGAGPGSFTGLRIGLSFLKGLSFAWQVPLVVYSTLSAAARELTGTHPSVLVCIEAGRGEVNVRAFCKAIASKEQQGDNSIFEAVQVLKKEEIPQCVKFLSEREGEIPGVLHDGCLEGLVDLSPKLMQRERLALRLVEMASEAGFPADWLSLSPSERAIEIATIEPLYGRQFRALSIADRMVASREKRGSSLQSI